MQGRKQNYTSEGTEPYKLQLMYLFLQTEKVELETMVVDETKEREAHAGQANGRLSS